MFRKEDDKLIVFIPRCKCGRALVPYGKLGLSHEAGRTPAAIMSNVTMSPAVTWTQVAWHCRKHPSMGYQFPIEDIIQINQYPESRIMFKSEGDE